MKGLKERTSDRPDFQSKETLFQSAPCLKERTGPLTEGMDFRSRDCSSATSFERERERETQRETETDRQTDRQTDRDRETHRENE